MAWTSEQISGKQQAAELSSPKDRSCGHQLLHSTAGIPCPKGLAEPGSSDPPRPSGPATWLGGDYEHQSHVITRMRMQLHKTKARAMIQQATAARFQMVFKKHLKGKETNNGGRCGFWGQREERWLKIWFTAGEELATREQGGSLRQQQPQSRLLSYHQCWGHRKRQKEVSFGLNSNGDGGREERCQFQTEGEGNNFASYCAVSENPQGYPRLGRHRTAQLRILAA